MTLAWDLGRVAVGCVHVTAIAVAIPKPHSCYESSYDVTRIKTKKIAFEMYPQWRAEHLGRRCPRSSALREYSNDDASWRDDPWSRPLQLVCDGSDLLVISAGEDGRFGTTDDIRSDE